MREVLLLIFCAIFASWVCGYLSWIFYESMLDDREWYHGDPVYYRRAIVLLGGNLILGLLALLALR